MGLKRVISASGGGRTIKIAHQIKFFLIVSYKLATGTLGNIQENSLFFRSFFIFTTRGKEVFCQVGFLGCCKQEHCQKLKISSRAGQNQGWIVTCTESCLPFPDLCLLLPATPREVMWRSWTCELDAMTCVPLIWVLRSGSRHKPRNAQIQKAGWCWRLPLSPYTGTGRQRRE